MWGVEIEQKFKKEQNKFDSEEIPQTRTLT
jgi:hypothetical protein